MKSPNGSPKRFVGGQDEAQGAARVSPGVSISASERRMMQSSEMQDPSPPLARSPPVNIPRGVKDRCAPPAKSLPDQLFL